MLFGQSLFQSVLTRLDEEAGKDDATAEPEAATFRVRGLNSGFVAAADGINHTSGAAATSAYRDGLDTMHGYEPPSSPPHDETSGADEQMQPDTNGNGTQTDGQAATQTEAKQWRYLARLSPEEITEDLGLDAADTVATLTEKRRLFARSNHPDSVPEDFRAAANTRMKTANRLIDDAMNRLARG